MNLSFLQIQAENLEESVLIDGQEVTKDTDDEDEEGEKSTTISLNPVVVEGEEEEMIDASDFRSVLAGADPTGHHPHHPAAYHPHHGAHMMGGAHHTIGAHHPHHAAAAAAAAAHMGHPQAGLNGRMTPPPPPSHPGFAQMQPGSYATLTPLQPLPPISTMSDKFTAHHPYGNGNGGQGHQGKSFVLS